jgi:PHP family Zn ribbon phosphoesterase
MTEIVYAALPKRPNQPEVFGDQPIVNIDEEIEEIEWRMLAAPTRLPLRDVGTHTHTLGGLFIAAHIDRPVSSVFSQLGVLSGDEGFDALELSAHGVAEVWHPRTGDLPFIRSSDSHYLHTIGRAWSQAELPDFTVNSLRQALQDGSITISPPLGTK